MPLVAVGIELSDEERAALLAIVRSPRSEQRMVTRARVVLAAADGIPNRRIARAVGLSERKVGVWRNLVALNGGWTGWATAATRRPASL